MSDNGRALPSTVAPGESEDSIKDENVAETSNIKKSEAIQGDNRSTDTPSPAEILGHVGWLMMRSEAHRHIFVSDMEWLIVPPVTLKQFRIYMKEQTPFAFATWARLTEEAEARLQAGHRRLAPADWNGGDKLWLVDLIAPFGGTEGVLRDLSEVVFPGESFKALVPGDDGQGLQVLTVGGDKGEKPAAKSPVKKPTAGKSPPRKTRAKKSASNKTAAKKSPAKKTTAKVAPKKQRRAKK